MSATPNDHADPDLRAIVADQAKAIEELRARLDTVITPAEAPAVEPSPVSRRALFGLAGAGIVGAAVAVSAGPAAAGTAVGPGTANGEALAIGESNSGTATTSLVTNANTTAFTVTNSGTGVAAIAVNASSNIAAVSRIDARQQ